MKLLSSLLFCLSIAHISYASNDRESEHALKTLEIYTKVVSIETVKGKGNVPTMANYLAEQFRNAGFDSQDVRVIQKGALASLIVHYRGDGSGNKKPILLIGHMDVVDALPEDWERPPFKLTKDDTYFYGRGSIDNKLGISIISSTFIRLKKEGFTPNRDLIIAFSGDEETDMITTRMLANDIPELSEAEFALNSDAGGGNLRADGKAVAYLVQAAEKTYATFELTARNPGGHSSRPRADNAIYDLADVLKKIQAHQFPTMHSDMTRDFFRNTGLQLGGELGTAMINFAEDPSNQDAADRLSRESSYVGATRTTCIATMLQGGHAENALPQSATATINCRIFPGVTVAQVQAELEATVANDEIEFKVLGSPIESPISELRADVMAAVKKAVNPRYPGISIMGYMESGGTDGMHFRSAGIPTWAISSVFMDPNEMYAHGLNERLPIKAFYDGLEHWTIILKELAGPKQ